MDKLAHYSILDKIGEGGMGEVYRARDERLKREVAVKVLPESFVQDPERLARFEREAQTLAALQHPNVASIYGLEEDDGRRFLALELVPGEDLQKVMAKGRLPLEEVIGLATQIATAVEAAHEMGIVHRDLKPSNVMITPDGTAKVLDFGLAKAVEGEVSDSSLNLSNSPTLTGLMTEAHVILGTAAYMSPEQARGKKVDKRADVWSFGVILFEMLTGEQLFQGETVSDTLAGVLKTDIDYEHLPASTPHHIRMLLERCLTRDPKMRLRDMGEARIVLGVGEDVGIPKTEEAETTDGGGIRPLWLGLAAVAALIAGVALGSMLLSSGDGDSVPGVQRTLALDAGPGAAEPAAPTISPDGTRLAYIRDESIWIRDLDRVEPRHLDRTRDAVDLFWSPDGTRLGYLTGGQVMTVDPQDGVPVVLGPTGGALIVENGCGGTWSAEFGILFTTGRDHVYRMSDRGGDPSIFAEIDTSLGEADFHEPYLLPDGSLLVAPHLSAGSNGVTLLADGERFEIVAQGDSRLYHPSWSPTGHVLYERRGTNPGVWAIAFDPATRQPQGEPFILHPNGRHPTAASDGSVVLVEGGASRDLQVVESDAEGNILRRIGEPGTFDWFMELAPDENRLALVRNSEDGGEIWIRDLTRGTESRFTFSAGFKRDPNWSADGKYLNYYVGRGASSIYSLRQTVDTGDPPDTLYNRTIGGDFIGEGTDMLVSSTLQGRDTQWDIYRVTGEREGQRTPLVEDAEWQYGPKLSPDQTYFAYISGETGVDQVFLKRFPDGSGKWQVSVNGGQWPRWTADGKRIVYVQGDDLMEVAIETSDPPVLGQPRKLFTRKPIGFSPPFGWEPDFTMNQDGTRFYFLESVGEETRGTTMMLLENWHRPQEEE